MHTHSHTRGIIRNTCGNTKSRRRTHDLNAQKLLLTFLQIKDPNSTIDFFNKSVKMSIVFCCCSPSSPLALFCFFCFFVFLGALPPYAAQRHKKHKAIYDIGNQRRALCVKNRIVFCFCFFLSLCVSVTVGVTSRFLSAAKQQI